MALKKNIELDNGVVIQYHRIISLYKITNEIIVIEVGSYVSHEIREEEPEKDVCIRIKSYNVDYNELYTITDAYNYLKTLNEFENAIDD